MNIIFLDFDGVISTQKVGYTGFEQECVDRVKIIIEKTDAYIVVSSTWRKTRDSLNQMKKILEEVGINKDKVIGITPTHLLSYEEECKRRASGKPFGRGVEISYWIKYSKEKGYNVESYVVLDDDVADIPPHLDRHVRTDCYLGINNKDVEKAIEILEKPMKEIKIHDLARGFVQSIFEGYNKLDKEK